MYILIHLVTYYTLQAHPHPLPVLVNQHPPPLYHFFCIKQTVTHTQIVVLGSLQLVDRSYLPRFEMVPRKQYPKRHFASVFTRHVSFPIYYTISWSVVDHHPIPGHIMRHRFAPSPGDNSFLSANSCIPPLLLVSPPNIF